MIERITVYLKNRGTLEKGRGNGKTMSQRARHLHAQAWRRLRGL
jgi:hypothetical protein